MEIVLNFLLNYITLAVAGIAFVIILVVLFAKGSHCPETPS